MLVMILVHIVNLLSAYKQKNKNVEIIIIVKLEYHRVKLTRKHAENWKVGYNTIQYIVHAVWLVQK